MTPDQKSAPPKPRLRAGAGAAPAREPPAILVVNDQRAQLVAMEATLSASGCRIVCASSGREALRRLLAEDFAVIVLDVRMPDLDGFETARLVRLRPRSESTPIIFATAQAMSPEDVRLGYAMGAVDYLVAPFDPVVLRAKVAVFVELFERSREVRSLAADMEEGLVRAERLNAELAREVAERRKAEASLAAEARELEAAVRELESYDYSVAHDLRAPVRAIHGYASMLLQQEGDRLSPETRGYLDRILAGAKRMSELIDGLLALSRAARAEMRRVPVDLSALATQILDALAHATPERRVEVSVEPGMIVSADPALLRVVLQNLLDNAWKFTRMREVAHIEVGSVPDADGPAYYVRDDGVGFDMASAGQIFQAFHRLHGQEGFEGTGIGLATARRVIERHGGRTWAEAAPDRGATFYFTLPSEAAPPQVD